MDQHKRLEFLHSASTTLSAISPSVSRHLTCTFLHHLQGQNLDQKIEKSFCSSCGTHFIPGSNAMVSIVKKLPRTKDWIHRLTLDKGKIPLKLYNYVLVKCQVCHVKTVLSGASKGEVQDVKNSLKAINETEPLKDLVKMPSAESSSTLAKTTKKKKRKNNLQELLAAKKVKQENASSSTGMNLDQFLNLI